MKPAYTLILLLSCAIVIPLYFLQGILNHIITSPYLQAFFTSAFLEELAKLIPLIPLFKRTRNIENRFFLPLAAILTGFGFAITENILYSVTLDGTGVIIRTFTTLPLHIGATLTIALLVNAAIRLSHPEKRQRHIIKGFAVGWLIHAVYNTLLITADRVDHSGWQALCIITAGALVLFSLLFPAAYLMREQIK